MGMRMGLTQEIGAFVAGMDAQRVPDAARATIRTGFTDCIGVMSAGWHDAAPALLRRLLPPCDDADWMRFLASSTAAAPDIGQVLGTAAHALDYDDVALNGHPSAVLVPAVLAEARVTQPDGGAMAAAYLAGYEVWAELIARDADLHHARGWHPSAVFGTLAATAASAALRRQDAATAARAIGIAASMASGLVANFGSMTKPFQLGRAVRAGLEATRLAEAGLTSSADAVEHPAGFLAAFSPRGAVDRESPAQLGTEWRILARGLNVKLYPMCYATHRILDAAGDLCHGHDIAAAQIAGVEVEIGATQATMLRNHAPRTPAEAKFSAEFAIAAMAVAGRCGLAEMAPGFVLRPEVQAIFPKVAIRTLDGRDPDETSLSPFDRVRLTLRDGSVLDSGPVTHPRGNIRRPATPAELRAKFDDCTTAGGMRPDVASALFARCQAVETLPGLGALLA
jgi:2-methylcitrate dehydratase PrpD